MSTFLLLMGAHLAYSILCTLILSMSLSTFYISALSVLFIAYFFSTMSNKEDRIVPHTDRTIMPSPSCPNFPLPLGCWKHPNGIGKLGQHDVVPN